MRNSSMDKDRHFFRLGKKFEGKNKKSLGKDWKNSRERLRD
jgi:hypothetical protein